MAPGMRSLQAVLVLSMSGTAVRAAAGGAIPSAVLCAPLFVTVDKKQHTLNFKVFKLQWDMVPHMITYMYRIWKEI